jgi:hypothetical protein
MSERTDKIKKLAMEELGYLATRVIDGKVYGLTRFIFTIGLIVDVQEDGYERRYCYDSLGEAMSDFKTWDGRGHPPGAWIKCKGRGIDLSNPARDS